MTADGEPVVFYHFSNLHQGGDRVWRTHYDLLGPQHSLVLRALYHPYLSEIEKTERQLRRRQPGLLPIDPRPGWETMAALRAYTRLNEKIVSALRRPGRVKQFLRFCKSVLSQAKYPYIVEVPVAANGLNAELNSQIVGFHKLHHTTLRVGRTALRDGQIYYRWCFFDLATARAFAEQFGGAFYKTTGT